MKKTNRIFTLIFYILISLGLFYAIFFVFFDPNWSEILTDWTFLFTILFYVISIEEIYVWAKVGRRSEISDLIAIFFFFFLILFFTKDFLTSLMGAFSIYLWVGALELKEYPVLNKILVISLVTYNVIFVAGIISTFLGDPFVLNTAFSFSFWIILGLGFILFGRKYLVVWRFMSPSYLTLFLYIIAWLGVIFVNQYTPIDLNLKTPLGSIDIELIYPVLIGVNWLIYFVSGPILDKMLGIKRIEDEELLGLVESVKNDIGIKRKVKVGFGKYPILNAMAYGPIFDQRIAIIAETADQIPKDELKGIVAHELAHTKGKHTLILTFIASIDLFIRMIIGLPATYYDYTFGDPEIPMIGFIFINIVLYIFIYIFVRFLEGKADLKAKNSGYATELAKALYNLEGFYATGREIGLNTMLLCDEKITKDNQFLDYIDTADYLYHSMIKPSRGSLLSNLLNSHPPSYFRIIAILGDNENYQLKPGKEALLPFICLKRSKQKKYAEKFKIAREKYKKIANLKIQSQFNIKNTSEKLESLKIKENYEFQIGKIFIFKNLITDKLVIGELIDIQINNDFTNQIDYKIVEYKSNEPRMLDSSLYSKIPIWLEGKYYFEDENALILSDVQLEEDQLNGNFIFKNGSITEDLIKKKINQTRLPLSVNLLEEYENEVIFLKTRNGLKLYRCISINYRENYQDIEISAKAINSKDENEQILTFSLQEIIIRPNKIFLSITRNDLYRESEKEIIEWLQENRIKVKVFLKKPVNNLETGIITTISLNYSDNGKMIPYRNENEAGSYIEMKNIFGDTVKIPYSKLEFFSFQYKTGQILFKKDTSYFSKLGYRIVHKFKPNRIFYLDKI